MDQQWSDDHAHEDAKKRHKFLALVPRGLHFFISGILTKNLPTGSKVTMIAESSEDIGLKARNILIELQQSKQNPQNTWFRHPTGSVALSKTKHINIGYTPQNPSTWSVPGEFAGSVWTEVETEDVESIASMRCLGPLMALVSVSNLQILARPNHCMEDLIREISQLLASSSSYASDLESALGLWKTYVDVSWKKEFSTPEFFALLERIQSNRVRYRLSCIRDNSGVSYTRHEFLQAVMMSSEVLIFPNNCNQGWTVSLTQFDVELVLVLLSSGILAIGISLCPYAYLKAKSFAYGGIPPDVTPPYIGGEILSTLVRLRPTTSHLLLHLANVDRYEVVLDPCAGIGTIPLEADVYSNKSIGIGGDVVLHQPPVASAAHALERGARNSIASSCLSAWDASYLPVRTSSVDAIVSDLPFGQQCLSANALSQLLPLMFLQCARVLQPNHGRMLLLCGSPMAVMIALEESRDYWSQPCTMVCPVTIGGLSAWVVRVERSRASFTCGVLNWSERVRKLARKRDQVARQQKSAGDVDVINKKRRRRKIQPNEE